MTSIICFNPKTITSKTNGCDTAPGNLVTLTYGTKLIKRLGSYAVCSAIKPLLKLYYFEDSNFPKR